jgi:hypothetical protein
MKLIRTVSIAIAFLIPAAALASPTVRQPVAGCTMGCCPDCQDCPFCPSGLHR